MVGGSLPSKMAMAVNAISTAPEAPRRWPIMDLVEETCSFLAWSPKTSLMALVSVLSLSSVLVPWALM